VEYRHHSAHLPYTPPRTPTPRCISAPSTHTGLRSCTGIVIRSRRSGGTSYREDWLIGRDTNIAHFRLWIHGRSLGHSTPWMRGRCMPSRPHSRLMVGFSFAFGWCSCRRESLWRVRCVQKVPLVGRTILTGRVQGRKDELRQSILSLPAIPPAGSHFLPPLVIASFAGPTMALHSHIDIPYTTPNHVVRVSPIHPFLYNYNLTSFHHSIAD
jgi:hypothetical protein